MGFSQFQPERDRFRVDAVAAPDRRGQLVLDGAALERFEKRIEISEENVARLRKLHGKAGVEHVRAGHALVQEARLVARAFGNPGQESDDVVFDLGLDRVDAGDVDAVCERRGGVDRGNRPRRDNAKLFELFGREHFDVEPDAEPVFRRPDRGHGRAGITGNHQASCANGECRAASS